MLAQNVLFLARCSPQRRLIDSLKTFPLNFPKTSLKTTTQVRSCFLHLAPSYSEGISTHRVAPRNLWRPRMTWFVSWDLLKQLPTRGKGWIQSIWSHQQKKGGGCIKNLKISTVPADNFCKNVLSWTWWMHCLGYKTEGHWTWPLDSWL